MKKIIIILLLLSLTSFCYASGRHLNLEKTVDNAVDGMTDAIVEINYEHHEIHSGSNYITMDAVDVASGSHLAYLIRTPNSAKLAHFIYNIRAEGESEIKLYENPTVTVVGTAMTPRNRYRDSTNSATVLVYKFPTCTASGDTLAIDHFGGAALGGRTVGGEARSESEFILKANEDYLLYFGNEAGTANEATIRMDWYEHANLN